MIDDEQLFRCPYGTFFHLGACPLFPAVNCRVILKNPYGIYFLAQQEFDISTKISHYVTPLNPSRQGRLKIARRFNGGENVHR